MYKNLAIGLAAVMVIFLGVFLTHKERPLGSLATGQTAKDATASSTVYSCTGATRVIATSTSRNRDYFRLSVSSGSAFCLMRNGSAASATDYSFVLSSTTPFFAMEAGVYQGTVSCTGTATVASVVGNLI